MSLGLLIIILLSGCLGMLWGKSDKNRQILIFSLTAAAAGLLILVILLLSGESR